MSEEQEVRATYEEVEQFVGNLRGFNDSLDQLGRLCWEPSWIVPWTPRVEATG
jgi:hypothetical protein